MHFSFMDNLGTYSKQLYSKPLINQTSIFQISEKSDISGLWTHIHKLEKNPEYGVSRQHQGRCFVR